MFAQGTLTNPRSVEKPFGTEIKAFYDSVVNHQPSSVPWTETIKVIGILEAVYTSQVQGREIVLKLGR